MKASKEDIYKTRSPHSLHSQVFSFHDSYLVPPSGFMSRKGGAFSLKPTSQLIQSKYTSKIPEYEQGRMCPKVDQLADEKAVAVLCLRV